LNGIVSAAERIVARPPLLFLYVTETVPSLVERVLQGEGVDEGDRQRLQPAMAVLQFLATSWQEREGFPVAWDRAVLELRDLWGAACDLAGGSTSSTNRLDCGHLEQILAMVRALCV
jgi:hypothetical protein